jgi:hypothetical protein
MTNTVHAAQRGPKILLEPAAEQMLEMQRPALQAMAKVNDRMCEGLVAMNKEWTSFINRRLKEDLGVPERLAACSTLQDMFQVYANYVQNACTHYQSEFERLSKLNGSIAQEAMAAFQTHLSTAGKNSSESSAQAGNGAGRASKESVAAD